MKRHYRHRSLEVETSLRRGEDPATIAHTRVKKSLSEVQLCGNVGCVHLLMIDEVGAGEGSGVQRGAEFLWR